MRQLLAPAAGVAAFCVLSCGGGVAYASGTYEMCGQNEACGKLVLQR